MKNLIKILLLTLLVLLTVTSCKRTKDQYHYSGKIIPRQKFIKFLIDLHITDATLANINAWDNKLKNHDSLSYYNYLLKKYDINYMDFERSLNYYMRDVEDFQDLYKIVIDSLKNRLYILDSMQQKSLSKPNLWTGKKYYLIPFQDNPQDSIPFEYDDPKPGIYELSADIMVFDDDKTYNLEMLMAVQYEDGSGDTVTSSIYFKDNQFHKYIVKLRVKDSIKPVKIYGNLLDYSKSLYMHVKVRKIRLIRYELSEMPWYKNQSSSGIQVQVN